MVTNKTIPIPIMTGSNPVGKGEIILNIRETIPIKQTFLIHSPLLCSEILFLAIFLFNPFN